MHVFIDTNVILEGRPLDQLRWKDLDAVGPIVIWLVPQVLREIDKRKRDGRLGEKARIEFRVAMPQAIDWDQFPQFDRGEPDDRVVAEILHVAEVAEVADAEKLVLSQDINPLRLARSVGLPVRHMDASWLAPKEPSLPCAGERLRPRRTGAKSGPERRSKNATFEVSHDLGDQEASPRLALRPRA